MIGHEDVQGFELLGQLVFVVASELHQEQCVSLLAVDIDKRIGNNRSKDRVGPAKLNHGSVYKFNRNRFELHNFFGELHRGLEVRKVHNPKKFVGRKL